MSADETREVQKTATSAKSSGEVVDLLAALQRSVDAAKTARGESVPGANETRETLAAASSDEKAHLVSWPGQCCGGYCVEALNIHGEESEADALDAAESASWLVEKTVAAALAPVVAVLDEYAASCNPGPFTSERALYERLRGAVAPRAQTPSGGDA